VQPTYRLVTTLLASNSSHYNPNKKHGINLSKTYNYAQSRRILFPERGTPGHHNEYAKQTFPLKLNERV
jgi:hypothetical protein